MGIGATGTYLYDATPPSTPTIQVPLSGTYINTGSI